VSEVDGVPDLRDFSRLAVVTVPAGVVLATVALWASLQLIGT
jgi:arsenical pump membrane protein